ncbi:MAG: arginine deiminase-related protein [Candidatus Sumerlaeaceae bacterium]|nr:arginine deiminase-related protein [Candidatus Sumerlaeaceae bacterium]
MNAMDSVTPRFLMCDPAYFTVEYAINPWMKGNLGKTDASLARDQWAALRRHIEEAGGIVEVEPADPELPDMVFTANVAAIVGRDALISHFTYPQRRREADHARQWLAGNGFTIHELPAGLDLEGTGDVLRDFQRPLVWAGYGYRSSLESHRVLAEALDYEVVTLRLVHPKFYHLDVCLAPLPDGSVMYYPPAFDDASLAAITSRVPESQRIAVSEEDAVNLACNAVSCGNTIILYRATPPLRSALEARGFRVVEVDLSQFLLSGGSARCMVLPLTEPRLPGGRAIHHLVETTLHVDGHLLDFGVLARILDLVVEQGCSFEVQHFEPGRRREDMSRARLRLIAPSTEALQEATSRVDELAAQFAHLTVAVGG